MGKLIPEDLVEQIRRSTNIVDVISDYVQLKKQGHNHFGLCPFHGEKTPSFSVSEDKQIFHCFGCGAGGNVFTFLMQIEGFSFLEAVKVLAQRAQITIPDTETMVEANKDHTRSHMIAAHELLAKLYHHILMHTKEGEEAKRYVIEERGFTEEMIKAFQIGYAPPSFDLATKFLSKRKFLVNEMVHAGLLSESNDGKIFDKFRHRVMFPIWNRQGQVVAFGGRALNEEKPKYLNSPETKIFNKSYTLYNLHKARALARKKQQLILFEGYIDVISAYHAGIQNGVASLGTSLTEEQAKMMARLVDQIIICYDSDDAGVQASFRAAKLLEDAECYVKIAQMPEQYDPDDYIRKFGGERFKSDVIGASLSVMAFKIKYLRRRRNLTDETERMHYIEDVLQEICFLKKAVERDHYLRQLADEFSISLDALKQQQTQMYYHLKKQNVGLEKQGSPLKVAVATLTQKPLLPAYQNAERILLSHMLKGEHIAYKIQEVIAGAFNTEEYAAIAANLYAFYEEGNKPDLGLFLQRLQNPELERIVTEIAMIPVEEDVSDEALNDYIQIVLNQPKWIKIDEKKRELKQAEKQQQFQRAAQIALEIIQLKKQLGFLK